MKQRFITHNRITLLLVLAVVFGSYGGAQPVHAAAACELTTCQEAWLNRVSTLFNVVIQGASLPFLGWNSIVVPTDPGMESWYLDKISAKGGYRWNSYDELTADLERSHFVKGRGTPKGQTWKLPEGYESDPCQAPPPSGAAPAVNPVSATTVETEAAAQLTLQRTYALYVAETGKLVDQRTSVGAPVSSSNLGDGLGAIALLVGLALIVLLVIRVTASRRQAHA